jgi:hypothetical protein
MIILNPVSFFLSLSYLFKAIPNLSYVTTILVSMMNFRLNRVLSLMGLTICAIAAVLQQSEAQLPAPGTNRVAYYVFDSHGPDHYPLTSFSDLANVVVIFEGTLWELADSAHYNSGWMRNVVYKSYSQILGDIRVLQARGVKVLMNVDDAASWSTSTPFSTYDGKKLDYQQFAAFVKACIDSARLDGICLDIEHKATANASYNSLLKEFGKYFGPRSIDSTSRMYIAAVYSSSSGAPGAIIGKSKEITSYMNFVMDMAYFSSNYTGRFTQWADSIGASKTMIGVLNDMNDLIFASTVAAWQPASPPKAGVMVYAANNLKSYTDGVFAALTTTDVREQEVPQGFALEQNYPNPFNPLTSIKYTVGGNRGEGVGARDVSLIVYDLLGREVATLVHERQAPGSYEVRFDGLKLASGVYIYRLTAGSLVASKTMVLLK